MVATGKQMATLTKLRAYTTKAPTAATTSHYQVAWVVSHIPNTTLGFISKTLGALRQHVLVEEDKVGGSNHCAWIRKNPNIASLCSWSVLTKHLETMCAPRHVVVALVQ
jgi:hypothetical protein